MKRRLFNAGALVSLVLCFPALFVWVDSYLKKTEITLGTANGSWIVNWGTGTVGIGHGRPGLVSPGWQRRVNYARYPDDSVLTHLVLFRGVTTPAGAACFFPVWLFLVPPLMMPTLWLWRSCRRPPAPHACPACGYDLRGTPGSECPECGAERAAISV